MLDESVSRLIADIYAGADDRAAWDAAMDAVIERLGAQWMMVGIFDERQRAPFEPTFHRVSHSGFIDAITEYQAETYRFDPTNSFAARHPGGGAFDSRMAVASPNDYLDHGFVRWNRANFGTTFWKMHYDGRDGLQLGASLHTTDEQGPLSAGQAELFALLYGHIEAAARLAARPPRLDGPEPVLLLDGRGQLVAASETAAILLALGDGIALGDGRPQATGRGSTAQFDRAIRSALGARRFGGKGGSAALERASGPALLATVTPLLAGDAPLPALRPQALVRLIDPALEPPAPVADWSILFGFTPAETRLARALLSGDGNLRHAADALGIAYATARTQLSGILAKAGAASQVQLVKLLTKLGCWALACIGALATLAEQIA